jgi:pilus assembly protein CpaE
MTFETNHHESRDRVRVFVTGSCEGLQAVAGALEAHDDIELVGSSEGVGDAAGVLTGGHLGVVVLATPGDTFPGDELAAIREHTRTPVVVVAAVESQSLLDEALDSGVADVILLPQLPENVVFAVKKAAHTGRRTQPAGAGRRGRIITVFSPKGGTGKTVTATNLAAVLAKQLSKRTLLLDLDLQFGDAAIMLGIEPQNTIHDLVSAPGELDSDKLAGYTTRHTSGLDVMAAPVRPEDAELVTEAKIGRLLEVARECYDLIVVDTSPFFHGPMLATLDRTDELLLLCLLDVPTVKNVRLSLQTLDLLSFPEDRVRIVLRRTTTKVGMKPKEVEAALERKISFEIPADRGVPLAVNRGNPLVLSEPRADFSSSIHAIAKALAVPSPKKAKARRRLFARAR